MGNIERISCMESRYNRVSVILEELHRTIVQYESIREDIAALDCYLQSADWREDFEADEKGQLPYGLKRGVLSEDGIWNLLEKEKGIMKHLQNMVTSANQRKPIP